MENNNLFCLEIWKGMAFMMIFRVYLWNNRRPEKWLTTNRSGKWKWRIPPCYFTDTRMSCVGFKSVTPIASSVVSKSGDTCLLNNGQPLHDYDFKYVWDTSFDLKIVAGNIACSWIFYPNYFGLIRSCFMLV